MNLSFGYIYIATSLGILILVLTHLSAQEYKLKVENKKKIENKNTQFPKVQGKTQQKHQPKKGNEEKNNIINILFS